jgi:zinc protease
VAGESVGTKGSAPAVTKAVLPNGLRTLVAERREAPVAAVLVFYRVGVLEEPPGKTGLAHLTEHMMFRGTERHPRGEVDSITTRLGGFNNAVTTGDYTVYYFVVPAEHWRIPLALEADRMVNLTFAESDFETEKRIAVEERAMLEDDPDSLLEEALDLLAFTRHPYRHPVVGVLDDLRGLRADDLRAFYARHYGPENAVVVVAGDVVSAVVLDAVRGLFGGLGRKGPPAPDVEPEPVQTSPRWRRIAGDTRSPRIVVAFRSPEATHPDAPALDIAASLLGAGKSSRLHRRLVVEERAATDVSAEWLLQREPGLFTFSAVLHPESDPERCEEVVLDVVRALVRGGILPEELHKAKKLTRVDLALAKETSLGLGGSLGFWELMGGWELGPDFERRALEVGRDSVERVAARYFDPDRRTSVWLLPADA